MRINEFENLKHGDRIRLRGREYTVLGMTYEVYSEVLPGAGELIVSVAPDDDDYIRRIGALDREVPEMELINEE